jgi:hypothetical protein
LEKLTCYRRGAIIQHWLGEKDTLFRHYNSAGRAELWGAPGFIEIICETRHCIVYRLVEPQEVLDRNYSYFRDNQIFRYYTKSKKRIEEASDKEKLLFLTRYIEDTDGGNLKYPNNEKQRTLFSFDGLRISYFGELEWTKYHDLKIL